MRTLLAPLSISLALSVTALGCLQSDVGHVIHVYPDGTARWTIQESDVHSDESDPATRDAEEQGWLDRMRDAATPEQRLLSALEPEAGVTTSMLDAERPMAAWLEARYDSFEDAITRLARLSDPDAQVTITSDGAERTLTISVHEDAGEKDPFERALGGTPEMDSLRLVLTRGRFVSASGFTLVDETTAEWKPEHADTSDDGLMTWSLSWVVE
jgi:hypothetical protein